MRRCFLALALPFVAVLIVGAASSTRAQTPAVRAGSWVRVSTDSGRPYLTGELISIEVDSIALRAADTIKLSRASVRRLEVRQATYRHPWKGLGLGALAGAVSVGTIAAATFKPCHCFSSFDSRSAVAYFGAVEGGFIGGLVGVAIGAAVVTDEWVGVELASPLRVGIEPGARRFDVGVTYRLR